MRETARGAGRIDPGGTVGESRQAQTGTPGTEGAAAEQQQIKVILADDDALARRVLRDALHEAGCTVIAEVGNGRDAVDLSLFYSPDIVIMDVVMPGMDGLAATREITSRRPDVKVLVLTSSDDDETALAALRAGAVGVLPKAVDLEVLPRALAAAHQGEAVVSRRVTMRLIETVRTLRPAGVGMRPVHSPLTSREWIVLDLMCAGRTTDEMADELVLSPETIRSHVKSILRKLEVGSRAEAVDVAMRLRGGEHAL